MYNVIMERTTIMADESVLDRLRRLARERGVSFAAVVREALDEKARTYQPKPLSLGSGESRPAAAARLQGSRRLPPRSWR